MTQLTIKPTGIVYWTRFFLGIIVGILCYILRLHGTEGIFTMITLFILSYLFVKYGLRYGEKELKGRNKRVMLGIGTYIFIWAAVWILLYTLYPYPIK